MAATEAAFKQMIATFIRQTRPYISRHGKPPRYPQRSLATAAAIQTAPEVEEDRPGWRPHPLPLANQPNITQQSRLEQLRSEPEPRAFSSFLTDNYAREHNYLRISLTERCNLRCLYCMPEEGVPLSPPDHILTTPEIVYLSSLFVNQGVDKIRLTGGEPTVRKDILDLMRQIGDLRKDGLKELCLTTNGISLHRKLDSMVESGLTGVNLSLDTLDPFQFTIMTRRNGHEAVMKSIDRILEMNKVGAGVKLKINCVVMRGMNEREIVPFVEMGREKDIEVRFIEYMPFDGNKWSQKKMLSFKEMLALIREKYPDVHKVQGHANDTSKTYKIPGFVGRIGFITSMTHNFCGTCNRLRITSDGNLKVCLFGNSEVSLRDILRESNEGKPIDAEAMEAIKQIEMNRRQHIPGHTSSLGVSEQEARLLDVIGMAVKRKKEKHADEVRLAHTNRHYTPYHVQPPLRTITPFVEVRSLSSSSHKFMPLNLPPLWHPPSMFQQLRSESSLISRRTYLVRARYRITHNSNTHRNIPHDRPPVIKQHRQTQIRSRNISPNPPPTVEQSREAKIRSRDYRLKMRAAREHLASKKSSSEVDEQIVTSVSSSSQQPSDAEASTHKTPEPVHSPQPLSHLTSSGEAHMINISHKTPTQRSATATSTLLFSTSDTYTALEQSALKKGDALAVARIAGIQAAKKTSDLIPLAHPGLSITGVKVDIEQIPPADRTRTARLPGEVYNHIQSRYGGVAIHVTVDCDGKTGVEMEAITAASMASVTLYDMLKGIDKGMVIVGTRVTKKSGGKSGSWVWDEQNRRIVKVDQSNDKSQNSTTIINDNKASDGREKIRRIFTPDPVGVKINFCGIRPPSLQDDKARPDDSLGGSDDTPSSTVQTTTGEPSNTKSSSSSQPTNPTTSTTTTEIDNHSNNLNNTDKPNQNTIQTNRPPLHQQNHQGQYQDHQHYENQYQDQNQDQTHHSDRLHPQDMTESNPTRIRQSDFALKRMQRYDEWARNA